MQCCSTDSAKISLKFTDTSRFLEHLSVKPGLKRLNFYGQTAIFDHFVRKRHFSIEPFTDRRSIFIDVSVNGSDFSKYSAHSVSTPSHQSKLPIRFASGYFHHGRRLSCIRKKQDDLQLIANHPVFQFETCFFSASSPIPITHQAIFFVKLHFYFNFKNIFLYIILMNILFKNQ